MGSNQDLIVNEQKECAFAVEKLNFLREDICNSTIRFLANNIMRLLWSLVAFASASGSEEFNEGGKRHRDRASTDDFSEEGRSIRSRTTEVIHRAYGPVSTLIRTFDSTCTIG